MSTFHASTDDALTQPSSFRGATGINSSGLVTLYIIIQCEFNSYCYANIFI